MLFPAFLIQCQNDFDYVLVSNVELETSYEAGACNFLKVQFCPMNILHSESQPLVSVPQVVRELSAGGTQKI